MPLNQPSCGKGSTVRTHHFKPLCGLMPEAPSHGDGQPLNASRKSSKHSSSRASTFTCRRLTEFRTRVQSFLKVKSHHEQNKQMSNTTPSIIAVPNTATFHFCHRPAYSHRPQSQRRNSHYAVPFHRQTLIWSQRHSQRRTCTGSRLFHSKAFRKMHRNPATFYTQILDPHDMQPTTQGARSATHPHKLHSQGTAPHLASTG